MSKSENPIPVPPPGHFPPASALLGVGFSCASAMPGTELGAGVRSARGAERELHGALLASMAAMLCEWNGWPRSLR